MISTSKATEILNNLFGVTNSTMNRPAKVYLGLSATKPEADGTIKVANKETDGEPTAENCQYSRRLVGGIDSKEVYFDSTAAEKGVISNTAEIKFNTAKAAYEKKMMYWFLSSDSTGAAFLWGRLKDVLFEKATKTFSEKDDTNAYVVNLQVDDLMNMKGATDYVVWWRNANDPKDKGKEYDVKSTEYTKNNTAYIHLGNPVVKGGADDGTPFAILYKQVTVGADTTGHISIYSTKPGSFEAAVYGLGIEVKKATVPTFYDGELTASIEVQTDED